MISSLKLIQYGKQPATNSATTKPVAGGVSKSGAMPSRQPEVSASAEKVGATTVTQMAASQAAAGHSRLDPDYSRYVDLAFNSIH